MGRVTAFEHKADAREGAVSPSSVPDRGMSHASPTFLGRGGGPPDAIVAALAHWAEDDPRQAVEHWRREHKARARAAVAAKNRESNFDPADDIQRGIILGTTEREADAEADMLLERGFLTNGAVKRLGRRKRNELDVELEHTVNLTNDTGADPLKPERHWEKSDLQSIDATLDRAPPQHLENLTEIRRSRMLLDKEHVTAAGAYIPTDRRIEIYDVGTNPETHMRDEGSLSALSGHRRGHPGERPLDQLEEIVAHEIGHHVAHEKPGLAHKFLKQSRDGHRRILPKAHGYEYAATNGGEHFAELYQKLLNVPERTQAEMQNDPASSENLTAQRDFFRGRIFGVDEKLITSKTHGLLDGVAAPQHLAAVSIASEFHRKAQQAMTPDHVDRLFKQYEREIRSIPSAKR